MALAPHRLPPRPWRRITDAERPATGRPPRDLRRTVDAIFWMAACSGPWKDLRAELGKPGTVALSLVKDVLGLVDAWPANPLLPPDRSLSKTAKDGLRTVCDALRLNTMLLVRSGSISTAA